MTTWYKATGMSFPKYVIPVEVERSTGKNIWINGRKHAITTSWSCYFKTPEQAWDWLEDQCQSRIESAKRRVEDALAEHDKIRKARQQSHRDTNR